MTRALSILLIEDNEVDVIAFERVLKRCSHAVDLKVAKNGREALDVLRAENAAESVSRPRLIFLDINMPEMNGHDFLTQMREDPSLASDVVFVLTTSDDVSDMERAFKMNIAGYIVKTPENTQADHLSEIVNLYCGAIRLPNVDD